MSQTTTRTSAPYRTADTTPNQVEENSSIGTSVGIIASAIDADLGDNVTYTLSDDAGGLFGIGETSGEVTVSGSLDYETAVSHDITVLATSTDGSTSSESFTISVTDDVSDNNTNIGPISDGDTTPNQVEKTHQSAHQLGLLHRL